MSDQITQALDLLKAGDFAVGLQWQRAHDLCQGHEGEADFDWIHALVHRIEGDDANAAYWYRRAGRARHAGTVAQEWETMRLALA